MLLAIAWVSAAIVVAPLIHTRLTSRLPSLLWVVPALAACYFLAQSADIQDGGAVVQSFEWVPSLDISLTFRLDGLSWLFALLITGIGAVVVMYANAYLSDDPARGRFFSSFFLFMAAMLALVLADDIVVLFVAWELTSFSSYLLIGHKHEDEGSRKAALQALLVTSSGGLALLAGLILLADVAGTTSISGIVASGEQVTASDRYPAILLLVCFGAFTKSAQVPFHFWLPGAMAAPTPVSAYLHSATMVKAGVYLLARLHPALGGTDEWLLSLTCFGGATALVGAYLALQHRDLKLIFAYSTVSMLGLLVFLLGIGSHEAVIAAITLLIAHAGYKAVLFLCSGSIDHEAGTRDLSLLQGAGRAMPFTAAAGAIGLVALAGLPSTLTFIGNEEALLAAGNEAWSLVLLATVIGAKALATAVAIVVGLRIAGFSGSRRHSGLHDPSWVMTIPVLALALTTLVLGTLPGWASSAIIEPAVSATEGQAAEVHLSLWHGFSVELLLTLLSFALGGAIAAVWLTRGGFVPFMADVAGRVGPSVAYERLLGAVLATGRLQDRLIDKGKPRHFVAIIVSVWLVLAVAGMARSTDDFAFPSAGNVGAYELLSIALIAVGAIGSVLARSQLAAVAFLGAAGYGVALVYILFSAPDLAMTQVLVETLTVLLFVLVFYRLPRYSRFSSAAARWRDAVIAGATGTVASLLVLFVLAADQGDPVSGYFLEESVPSAFGRNVVNVILVDFRALDTLGEIAVLAIAALGVYALVRTGIKKERSR